MILNREKLFLIKKTLKDSGAIPGSIVAIFNDIENKWYYYVGNLTLKDPSSGIYANRLIDARCLNIVLDNTDTFFTGNSISSNLTLITKIENIPMEDIRSFDFRVIQF